MQLHECMADEDINIFGALVLITCDVSRSASVRPTPMMPGRHHGWARYSRCRARKPRRLLIECDVCDDNTFCFEAKNFDILYSDSNSCECDDSDEKTFCCEATKFDI